MEVLRTALGSAGLRRLLTASAVSYLGYWLFTIVFSIYAYQHGGAKAVGLAAVARQLPTAMAAPSITLFADRYPRRTVLLVSGLAQAVLIGAAAAVAAGGLEYGLVLSLAAVATVAGAPFRPAQLALIPRLAGTPAQIAAANVAWGAVEYAGFLGGALAAAALISALGIDATLGSSAVPFALGTAVFLWLPTDDPVPPSEEESAWAELLAGVRTIWRQPEMRLMSTVYGADAVVQGTVDVLLVTCAIALLKTGDSGVGLLNTAWGVGGLLGGWAALMLLARGRLASGVGWGCTLAGLPLVVIGLWPHRTGALALLVVLGVGYAVLEAALTTLIQRRASDDVLARVFGVHESMLLAGLALGGVISGALITAVGINAALVTVGLVLPALAVVLRRSLRRLEAGVAVPERAFVRLRELDMFRPLPIATIENLATRSEVVAVPATSEVIRQGDAGDRFFVIDDGVLDVFVDGRSVAERHPGEHFGEIALLKDQPRMATVQARTDATLIALDRAEFLAAVGAHAGSARVAARVADERLATAAPVQAVDG